MAPLQINSAGSGVFLDVGLLDRGERRLFFFVGGGGSSLPASRRQVLSVDTLHSNGDMTSDNVRAWAEAGFGAEYGFGTPQVRLRYRLGVRHQANVGLGAWQARVGPDEANGRVLRIDHSLGAVARASLQLDLDNRAPGRVLLSFDTSLSYGWQLPGVQLALEGPQPMLDTAPPSAIDLTADVSLIVRF